MEVVPMKKEKDESLKDKEHTFKDKERTPRQKDEVEEITPKKSKKKKIFLILGLILVPFLLVGIYYFAFFPSLVLVGNSTIEVAYPDTYTDEGAKLYRLGKETNGNILVDNKVDATKLGEYEIKYTYKESFFSKSLVRKVFIVDKEPPVLTLEGDKDVVVCPGQKYEEKGYSATDNYDGDLTSQVATLEEEGKINYSVVDSSGNRTTDTRTITEKDDDKPKITLTGSSTTYLILGKAYSEPGYKASDNCDGDLTKQVQVSGSVNKDKEGTYTLTYSVSDSMGNKTSVTRKVVVQKAPSNSGVIYLTFDDGPNDTSTTKILDVLKKYNVKATFFVTMSGSDSVILREYQEGHTVALHTASHNYKTVYSSVDGYFNDLNKVSNRVKKITGETSYIIRFPGGSSNTVSRNYSKGIMTTLTKEVEKRGYHYFDWNVSSGDAGETTSSKGVYNNVTKSLRLNRANIVLMHDIKSFTAAAIEDIIVYGKEHGYTFAPITMATTPVHHSVNN